ncbi:MAG: fibronectin type III domain-containing protein, partial [Anaerovorax sp.]
MRKRIVKTLIPLTLALLLCLSGVPVWAQEGEETLLQSVTAPEQITLSLTERSSEMAVTWCDTPSVSNPRVAYSTDAAFGAAHVKTVNGVRTTSGSGFQYFEGVMTGLEEGQTYYYKVGSQSTAQQFTNGSGRDGKGDFHFMYLGDVQFRNNCMDADYEAWKQLAE